MRLSGHLGSTASALVDGQLDEASTDRAWAHVATCPPCRRVVETETTVKRRLAAMADAPSAERAPDQLLGSLLDLDLDPAAVAWAETREIERSGRGRRRAGIALVGAGSVSAAVFGLSSLSASPLSVGGGTGSPAGPVGGTTSIPTRAVVGPAADVHGRLRGWRLGRDDLGVVHARMVAVHP